MASLMVVSADGLREHLAYHEWANLRLLEGATKLSEQERNYDFQTANHTILGTLVHIFAADRIWLARMEQTSPPEFVTAADHDFTVLQHEWPLLLQRWQKWAGGLNDQQANSPMSYKDLKGKSWSQPLWQPILHTVNHGTHHRGQVSGFMRALGHVPPILDLAYYYRQKA